MTAAVTLVEAAHEAEAVEEARAAPAIEIGLLLEALAAHAAHLAEIQEEERLQREATSHLREQVKDLVRDAVARVGRALPDGTTGPRATNWGTLEGGPWVELTSVAKTSAEAVVQLRALRDWTAQLIRTLPPAHRLRRETKLLTAEAAAVARVAQRAAEARKVAKAAKEETK